MITRQSWWLTCRLGFYKLFVSIMSPPCFSPEISPNSVERQYAITFTTKSLAKQFGAPKQLSAILWKIIHIKSLNEIVMILNLFCNILPNIITAKAFRPRPLTFTRYSSDTKMNSNRPCLCGNCSVVCICGSGGRNSSAEEKRLSAHTVHNVLKTQVAERNSSSPHTHTPCDSSFFFL